MVLIILRPPESFLDQLMFSWFFKVSVKFLFILLTNQSLFISQTSFLSSQLKVWTHQIQFTQKRIAWGHSTKSSWKMYGAGQTTYSPSNCAVVAATEINHWFILVGPTERFSGNILSLSRKETEKKSETALLSLHLKSLLNIYIYIERVIYRVRCKQCAPTLSY